MSNRRKQRLILATRQIPADYHDKRRLWWSQNSRLWSTHIDSDVARAGLLDRLATIAADCVMSVDSPSVLDFGCGEGAFLRTLQRKLPAASCVGLDFCAEMLTEATSRSVGFNLTYRLEDVESRTLTTDSAADLVTSILAVDEMEGVDIVCQNIAQSLCTGGTAMVVILDPTVEMARNQSELAEHLRGNNSQDPLLLIKTFPAPKKLCAAPYSRIVRPTANYLASAAAAGLQLYEQHNILHQVGSNTTGARLLFDVLVFHKR